MMTNVLSLGLSELLIRRPSHGKDIGGGAAPYTIVPSCGAVSHGVPRIAIIVQDSAPSSHGKDIGGGAAPYTFKVFWGATGHGGAADHVAPGITIIVQDCAVPPPTVKTSEGELPHTAESPYVVVPPVMVVLVMVVPLSIALQAWPS